MASPHATIAILSIGQMGLGIAQLLTAHNYRIITNASDRSKATQDRAKSAGIELFSTDEELVGEADYILSIVPPRDAVATAKRVETAFGKGTRDKPSQLYYLDMNAISPATAKAIAQSFSQNAPNIHFIDGGIIGGPPFPPSCGSPPSVINGTDWTRPDIPLSGPHPLNEAPVSGPHLAFILNTRNLGTKIGSASGLKCCFAALSKGCTSPPMFELHVRHILTFFAPSSSHGTGVTILHHSFLSKRTSRVTRLPRYIQSQCATEGREEHCRMYGESVPLGGGDESDRAVF
jgi:hypothetical protein